MGANCCVAAKDKPVPKETQFEVSAHRNIRYSPSWSFRWDNRTHVEDSMDNTRFSHHNSGNISSEIKSGTDTEIEGLSNGGSPFYPFQKSPIRTKASGNSKIDKGTADQSLESNSSPKDMETIKTSGKESASDTKPSISVPSTSSSTFIFDPSPSNRSSLPSDSRNSPLKSPNENSSPEFYLSTGGSEGGSSDGWSMHTFTDLVASSQRERRSFDTASPGSMKGKLSRSNTRPLPSLSTDPQTCGVCLKLLKEERSPWSTQKIVSTNELPVVAVLVCGHLYHAECLEIMTSETDRYEPSCPLCTKREISSPSKLLRKSESKARSKISRFAVADADGDFDSTSEFQKHGSKVPRMGASSSTKSLFSRPLMGRHFSMRSRSKRLVSEETTRKKGFWARYRRD